MKKIILSAFCLVVFAIPAIAQKQGTYTSNQSMTPKSNYNAVLQQLNAGNTMSKQQLSITIPNPQSQLQNNQLNNAENQQNSINNTIKPFINNY